MTTSALGLILLIGAAVVIAAIVAARVAHGIGLPGLLLFLVLGLTLGEAGVGVRFDNAGLAQALGLSALVLILAEGGLTTSWAHARAAAPAALSLATVGVVVSVLVVAAAGRWLVHLGWREALLLERCLRRPMRPRCSRCCASCRCRRGCPECWKASRGSMTRQRCLR